MSSTFAKGLEDLIKSKAPEEQTETPVVEAPVAEATTTEAPAVETVVEAPVVEQVKEKVISVAGMEIKIQQEEEAPAPTEITNEQSFFETVEKEYGISLSSLKDAASMFSKVKQVDEMSEKLTKAELYGGELQNFFAGLPTDLKASIQAYGEGKDYREILRKTIGGTIDYSQPVGSYSQEQLIKAFNPELTDDDFEDMSDRERKALYDSASLKYNNEHNNLKVEGNKIFEDSKVKAEKFVDSVKKATANLASTSSNIKKEEVARLETKMKTNIADIFYNEEGLYKEDAAERLYFAMNGKEIVNALILEIEKESKRKIKQAQSETAEKIVGEYTNDKIKPSGGGGGTITVEDSVKKTLPKALGGTA